MSGHWSTTLTFELLETRGPEVPVKMEENLGVRLGPEPVAHRLKAGTEVEKVEDLPVEDDPERFVFVGDRLLASLQIDDAEPCASQADGMIHVDSELIRSPMADHSEHAQKSGLLDRSRVRETEGPDDAAHQERLAGWLLHDVVLGSSSLNSTYFGTRWSSRCARQ